MLYIDQTQEIEVRLIYIQGTYHVKVMMVSQLLWNNYTQANPLYTYHIDSVLQVYHFCLVDPEMQVLHLGCPIIPRIM